MPVEKKNKQTKYTHDKRTHNIIKNEEKKKNHWSQAIACKRQIAYDIYDVCVCISMNFNHPKRWIDSFLWCLYTSTGKPKYNHHFLHSLNLFHEIFQRIMRKNNLFKKQRTLRFTEPPIECFQISIIECYVLDSIESSGHFDWNDANFWLWA